MQSVARRGLGSLDGRGEQVIAPPLQGTGTLHILKDPHRLSMSRTLQLLQSNLGPAVPLGHPDSPEEWIRRGAGSSGARGGVPQTQSSSPHPLARRRLPSAHPQSSACLTENPHFSQEYFPLPSIPSEVGEKCRCVEQQPYQTPERRSSKR